jgi:hypothetical protein
MSLKKYIWKGSATMIELWDDSYQTVLFSNFMITDQLLPVDVDDSHPIVQGWLDFGLIEEIAPPKILKTKEVSNA